MRWCWLRDRKAKRSPGFELIQLNCHNCRQTNFELNNLLSEGKNNIALLQEPYVNNKGELANDFQGFDRYPRKINEQPRTSIIAARGLQTVELTEFCNKFTTTIACKQGEKWFVLSSVATAVSAQLPDQPD